MVRVTQCQTFLDLIFLMHLSFFKRKILVNGQPVPSFPKSLFFQMTPPPANKVYRCFALGYSYGAFNIYIYIYIYIVTVLVVTNSLCGFVVNQVWYNLESAQYLWMSYYIIICHGSLSATLGFRKFYKQQLSGR